MRSGNCWTKGSFPPCALGRRVAVPGAVDSPTANAIAAHTNRRFCNGGCIFCWGMRIPGGARHGGPGRARPRALRITQRRCQLQVGDVERKADPAVFHRRYDPRLPGAGVLFVFFPILPRVAAGICFKYAGKVAWRGEAEICADGGKRFVRIAEQALGLFGLFF